MNIIVTGGAGFIGSNLVERLIGNKKDKIYVIDNLSTGSIKNIAKFLDYDNFKFLKYDITSKSIINKIKNLNADVIYNFACPASPAYYLEKPIETWEASVLGIKNLLEAIKNTRIKLFQSSTSEIYGSALVSPQDECYWGNVNCIGVRACYDEGKRAAETLIYDYIRKFNVDVRVARIFNTYGPNMQKKDGRVIPNFINQALNNEDITIYGDGKQTRSFCYIDDTLNFIVNLMNMKKAPKEPINVGNPQEVSILEVAEIVKEITKSSSNIVHKPAMLDDPQRRRPNVLKAKEIIKWEPKVSIEEGIRKTIDYYSRLIV